MKNILLIVVDTLRPDHLGCYGYDRPTSPCLDALAQKSTVLDSLWSASNYTAPAFTSLFTGLYPHQHGVFDFTSQAPSSPILDLFNQNRAQTSAVVTFRFFQNLLKQIWGEVEAVTDTRSFDYSKDLPLAVTESCLDWLKNKRQQAPFCLFAHYDGPHLPFRLPDEFAGPFDTFNPDGVDSEFQRLFFPQDQERLDQSAGPSEVSMFKLLEDINWGRRKVDDNNLTWMKDKYDASVLYNDHAIGKLLEGLKDLDLEDETIVAILSDHGEEFMEHGAIGHGGIHLNEEIIRTVGIIHDPGGPAGHRVTHPLSQVDFFPTLLALAGANNIPEQWNARSFKNLVLGQEAASNQGQPVFCHGKSKLAVRHGNLKFIKTHPTNVLPLKDRLKLLAKMVLRKELKSEIYDLADDPLELKNILNQSDSRKRLEALIKDHLQNHEGELKALDADDEERKRIEKEMKDLGYM